VTLTLSTIWMKTQMGTIMLKTGVERAILKCVTVWWGTCYFPRRGSVSRQTDRHI